MDWSGVNWTEVQAGVGCIALRFSKSKSSRVARVSPRPNDRAAKRARYIVALRKDVRAYRGDPSRVKGRWDKSKERGRTALRLRSG